MKKSLIILLASAMLVLVGCGAKEETREETADVVEVTTPSTPEEDEKTEPIITDEQALNAIKNYCYATNPDLKEMVNDDEYTLYWEIESSDDSQIVVLYRAYTGALVRYYIDANTGDTYVTEYVQGITDEEEKTDESFNVKDYFSAQAAESESQLN